jgi:hypothetical protein
MNKNSLTETLLHRGLFYDALIHELTAADTKASLAKGYNPYALAQLLQAADAVRDEMAAGKDASGAFATNFTATKTNHGIAGRLGLTLDAAHGDWVLK